MRSIFLGRNLLRLALMILVPGCGPVASIGFAQASKQVCESLQMPHLEKTDLLSASWVMAGAYTPPRPYPSAKTTEYRLSGHCIVKLAAHPSADSDIRVELWLPEGHAWNGKFLGTGNGGYSSNLSYDQMAEAVARGYAVGGSDTGHQGDDLSFGVGHPEKIRDWAYRSTHLLAQSGRALVSAFYGRQAAHAYFSGCSTGGQQALSEAQRYPDDFDGIIAGDPGNDRILLNADFVESWRATHPDGGTKFDVRKLAALNKASIAACDKDDGVADGIVSNPLSCHFDPASLRCPSGTNDLSCLTDAEVTAVQDLYAGPVLGRDGKPIYPGWSRSSEAGWGSYLVNPSEPVRFVFWRLWVYSDPGFAVESFKPETAIAKAQQEMPYVEATETDLRAFQKRGGKLLMYHGWADPVVPPENTIQYYKGVERRLGGDTDNSLRLFMVPGMYHCGGGPGVSTFDTLGALDTWVSSGKSPDRLLATHQENGAAVFSRPLCPYPQTPRWDGEHSVSSAASFNCAVPGKGSGATR
jgi:feruloyl esterase